jgi:hypothetical protein
MKYYLFALLFVIMGAGARTMFEIAHHGMGHEHDFAPSAEITRLIFLALWFVVMMIGNVILLRHKDFPYRNGLVLLLSIGVLSPVVFMLATK